MAPPDAGICRGGLVRPARWQMHALDRQPRSGNTRGWFDPDNHRRLVRTEPAGFRLRAFRDARRCGRAAGTATHRPSAGPGRGQHLGRWNLADELERRRGLRKPGALPVAGPPPRSRATPAPACRRPRRHRDGCCRPRGRWTVGALRPPITRAGSSCASPPRRPREILHPDRASCPAACGPARGRRRYRNGCCRPAGRWKDGPARPPVTRAGYSRFRYPDWRESSHGGAPARRGAALDHGGCGLRPRRGGYPVRLAQGSLAGADIPDCCCGGSRSSSTRAPREDQVFSATADCCPERCRTVRDASGLDSACSRRSGHLRQHFRLSTPARWI